MAALGVSSFLSPSAVLGTFTGHCQGMEGLWVHGVLLIFLLPCPVGSQTSSIPEQRWWTPPNEAPSQQQAAR